MSPLVRPRPLITREDMVTVTSTCWHLRHTVIARVRSRYTRIPRWWTCRACGIGWYSPPEQEPTR